MASPYDSCWRTVLKLIKELQIIWVPADRVRVWVRGHTFSAFQTAGCRRPQRRDGLFNIGSLHCLLVAGQLIGSHSAPGKSQGGRLEIMRRVRRTRMNCTALSK